MSSRDADATRDRLLAAATSEFARHGIAGARVDRIATAARSNKAQIYHYFSSKVGLFDAVMGNCAQQSSSDGHFDPDDLPETAARIYDDFEANPQLGRLVTWYRLEAGTAGMDISTLAESTRAKVSGIAAAQQRGVVTTALPPTVILALVLTIAGSWTDVPAGFESIRTETTAAERRAYVIEAVRRLVTP